MQGVVPCAATPRLFAVNRLPHAEQHLQKTHRISSDELAAIAANLSRAFGSLQERRPAVAAPRGLGMQANAPKSFSSVFNPATCLPWRTTSKELKQGFNEALYSMRSKFVVWWCLSFSIPVIFILAIGRNDRDTALIGLTYLIFYVICIILFAIPWFRVLVLRGKYSHLAISLLVVISYSVEIIVNLLGPSQAPYGGLPILRRSLFGIMLIVCTIFVHANTLVVGIAHFTFFATTVHVVGIRELSPAAFLMSSMLYGVVSIMMFFVYYHICFVRCQEFLLREHAVASRAASVATKLNNNFICQVLHDLGTPLTTIALGVQEIEAEATQRDTDRSYLKDMKLACWYLKSLRDRAIQYARLTMKSSLPFVRISTIDVRDFMTARFMPLAQVYRSHGNVELNLNISHDVPQMIQTEPDWLMDILLNLVSNAYKFTPAGHVTVSIEMKAEQTRETIQFCVADTGPGVPEADKANLFQAFEQGPQVDKVFQGTGLGLWSVRMKVEALSGTCGVKDNDPQGSIFFVALPAQFNQETIEVAPAAENEPVPFDLLNLKPSELPTPQGLPTPTQSDRDAQRTASDSFTFQVSEGSASAKADAMRVLVVEDQTIIRRMLRKALERRGVVVDEACDGKEGLDLMKSSHYDCVLSDLLMPEMDGFQMIEQLRQWETEQPSQRHQLVFALSGTCLEESRAEAMAKGMDGFFAKPVDIDTVMARIQSCRPAAA